MSVAENIDTVLSSLWQLAMAMASLKHIAEMVLQEEDLASDNTGQEEDHSLPDTHRHSHDKETEASRDDSFANNENTESEEIELAALISSLTLTMVCQQNNTPPMKVFLPKELIANIDETEPESIPKSSMIGHQLPKLDSPLYISEIPLSMAAHVITANIEKAGHLFDTENISMISKKDRTVEEFVCKEEENVCELSTLANDKQAKTNFSESEVSSNSPEDNLTVYETSMCTHKLSCLQTPLSDYQVSMVPHHQSVTENNVDSSSLVCHQAPIHHNVLQHRRESTKMSETETIPTKQKVDSTFSTTLLAHQISPVDDYLESSEFPISMVAHMIISNEDGETFNQSNEIFSMVVHQIVNEVTIATEIEKTNETVKDLFDYIITEDEENCSIRESIFFSTLCSHQLSTIKTPLENDEYPVSLSVHTVDNYSEEEKTLDLSLSSHKLPFRACRSEFASPSYVPMVSYQNISYVDENTNSLVSMADHMADSLRNKSNEAAPTNAENMKSHYQGKSAEGEEEGRVHVEEDIAQNIQKDHPTRLPKIEEIQSPDDVEIEEFKIKRKNNQRINENNVETTETHIVNNFKGVEFKSCIKVHQQLDEKYAAEDPDDIESVSSGDESIQSMLTTTEKINHLNTFDLISENASENLITASCKIEDNSPVVITTSNPKRDETDIIENRKTDTFQSNHQAKLYENKSGKNLDTKNQEEENKNTEIDNKKMIILKTLSTEAKTKEKSKKKEKSQISSTQIASFNANSGKQTYKIRFKVKPNEDPSKSSVLKYLLGYFGGQQ